MVMGEPRPCLPDLVVEAENVRVCRHPPSDRLVERIGPSGRGPQQVALGEDADDGALIGDHHRADLPAVHQ